MKNALIKYEKEELQEFVVSDYFSKKIDIFNIFYLLKDYLMLYKMDNDDKLERVSYELYGTPDYWDILLMINDRIPLYEMPYDYDIIEQRSNSIVSDYVNLIYSHMPLTQGRVQELKNDFLKVNDTLNESYRYIYVIKRENINEFITTLKDQGYL